MKLFELNSEVVINEPLDRVFPFFADARNLQRITPPWLNFEVTSPTPIEMKTGQTIDYRLKVHGIPMRWRSEITEWQPPHRFVDEQLTGPYALWHHTHTFVADGDETIMRDRVRYRIGFGPLGALANELLVRRDVEGIFDYRAERVRALI